MGIPCPREVCTFQGRSWELLPDVACYEEFLRRPVSMCCICPELLASSDPWLFAVASSLHLIAYLVGLSLLCALRR